MSGLFITFEGIEGCGKSTQARMLNDYLVKFGNCRTTLLTREPGGPPISEKIREILLDKEFPEMDRITELFLYLASRAQHTKQWIIPALQENKIVICDRYYDSTYAYQLIARDILSYSFFNAHFIDILNLISTYNIKPDITFIIDLPVEMGLQRVVNAGKLDRIENENLSFHKKVRQGFLDLAKREPERIKVIDGKNDVNKIHNDILNYVRKFISYLPLRAQ